MKSYPIERAHHFVLRAGNGDALPGDVTRALAKAGVTAGWLRASGVLSDVELRVYDTVAGGLARGRRIAGPVQALTIEGSIGLDKGEPSVGLHAVIGRETERGTEVIAGEIVSARIVALEAFVSAFDGLAIARAVDPAANVALVDDATIVALRVENVHRTAAGPKVNAPASAPSLPAVAEPTPPAANAWSEAISASAEQARPALNRGALGGAIPARLVRPAETQDESLIPQAGDIVEHFAFGRAEVVKSDGERLHLQVGNGRVREIAIEMLKVSPLPSDGPHKRFRLDRRI